MPEKTFIDFTVDGVEYIDIKATDWGKSYSVGVTGTAQMVRQWLRRFYPNIGAAVTSKSYSGGDSINIELTGLDEASFTDVYAKLQQKFQRGYFDGMTDSYVSTLRGTTTRDGKEISYGTKYLFARNYSGSTPSSSGRSSSSRSSSSGSGSGRSYKKPKGDLTYTCNSGWEIYRVIINTKGVDKAVYKFYKPYKVAPNKSDWDTIRGEMLNVGFKWNKFGQTFDMFVEDIKQSTIDAACKVLDKYYGSGETQPAPAPESTPEPTPQPTPSPAPEPTPAPTPSPDGKIRLRWIRINGAEGSGRYTDLFPKTFTSFREASNFIRDNIGDDFKKEGHGYDKHHVEYEWSDGSVEKNRYDVGVKDLNPFLWDNIFAFSFWRGAFFVTLGGNKKHIHDYQVYIAERGLEGLETTVDELERMAEWFAETPYYQNYYKKNKQQILAVIKDVFGSYFDKTNSETPQNIESIIRGYEVLLTMTNDPSEKQELQKLIRGYKLLQN